MTLNMLRVRVALPAGKYQHYFSDPVACLLGRRSGAENESQLIYTSERVNACAGPKEPSEPPVSVVSVDGTGETGQLYMKGGSTRSSTSVDPETITISKNRTDAKLNVLCGSAWRCDEVVVWVCMCRMSCVIYI